MKQETKKYRFDNAYEMIYELDGFGKSYVFLGSYYFYDITKNMSYEQATEIVEKERCYQ